MEDGKDEGKERGKNGRGVLYHILASVPGAPWSLKSSILPKLASVQR